MRVGLDISQIAHRGGVAIYTQRLAEELVKIGSPELIFFYSSLRQPYRGNLPNVKSFSLPPTIFEFLFNSLRFPPIEAFIGKIDVFHSSDWAQPKTEAKKVTTYHDLSPLLYPSWSQPKIVAVNKRRLKIVEEEIDMVIAVSNATKVDLLKISNIPKDKITVIYEGVDEIYKQQPKDLVNKFKQKYKLPENFILAIGGVGSRRNLDRVKQVSKKHNLMITGQNLPYLSPEEMPLLYSGADLLVYPSLYEGFGLPILEAMACGTPVITSNISAMAEIAGDCAILVDPTSLDQISRAIEQALNDQELRSGLINKGLDHAKKFSWSKCAQETIKVYQELV